MWSSSTAAAPISPRCASRSSGSARARWSAPIRDVIAAAPRVLLPGVGAAADAMARLRASGLDRLHSAAARSRCSASAWACSCCSSIPRKATRAASALLPGRIERLQPAPGLPVPHMGWNTLAAACARTRCSSGIARGDYVYFVHSYAAPVAEQTAVATVDYGAPLARRRSGAATSAARSFIPSARRRPGARLLHNFLAL